MPAMMIMNTAEDKPVYCLVLAFLAALLSYGIGQSVFWDAVLTTDEHAYLMQAYSYIEGRISRPLPELAEIFRHEMMIMDEQVGWLSRYPPGHAVWLMLGAAVNWPHLPVYLSAALSIWLFSRSGPLLGLPALLLPSMMVLSPYFLFMNGTLLSHSSALPAACLILWGYLAWKVKKRPFWAAIAGLAWAFLFLNRTYTGLLIALPFAVDALWDLAQNRSRANFHATILFALCAAAGGFGYLLYNYLAVGDPFTPTYLYYAPDDGLGFGWRSTSSLPYHHTFATGLAYLWENMVLLDRWLYGFPGSLLLCLGLAIVGWNKRWTPLCLAVVMTVACGYVFFWWRGVRDIGPVYYYETLPFLLLPAGLGIVRIARLSSSYRRLRAVAAAAGVMLVILSAVRFSIDQGSLIRDRQRIVGQFHALLGSAPDNSLIIVTGFRGMRHVEKGTSFNPRGIDSDPLVVAGTIPSEDIIRAHPGRTPYLMVRRGEHLVLESFH